MLYVAAFGSSHTKAMDENFLSVLIHSQNTLIRFFFQAHKTNECYVYFINYQRIPQKQEWYRQHGTTPAGIVYFCTEAFSTVCTIRFNGRPAL